MFIIVGMKEHAIIIESAPYEANLFGGKVVVTSQQPDRATMVAGQVENVDAFFAAWARASEQSLTDPSAAPDLHKLIGEHSVAFVQQPEGSVVPTVYFRDTSKPEGISGVTCTADQPYTFCHPSNETITVAVELRAMVGQFVEDTESTSEEIFQRIAQYVNVLYPALENGGSINYVNLANSTVMSLLESGEVNPVN